MSIPYIALYPGDFLADTGHLGNTELGIYWRLLLVYYRDGRPLPVDMDRLRRLAMTFSPEECRALESVVSEFFSLTTNPDGSRCWSHKRADVELERANKYLDAKRGGAEKARQKLAEKRAGSLISELTSKQTSGQSSALIPRGESEPESESESDSSKEEKQPSVVGAPRKRAAPKPKASKSCPDDFEPDQEMVAWALLNAPGVDWTRETLKFKTHEFKKAYTDWPKTWRAWMLRAHEFMQQRIQTRQPAKTSRHTGFDKTDYREGVNDDGSF